MRLTTNKSVSRLVGIWTFLLLFILKGVFPEPVYAFVLPLPSSLDGCAVQPACAETVGLELSPTIAAPTAEAAGTTAISTTTATGATTSSVEAVAGITVVGDMRLSGVAAFYFWNKAQNQKAQEKAKEKYCSANPSDPLCVYPGSYTVSVLAYTQHYVNPSTYSTPNCSVPGGDMSTAWEGIDLYVVADGGQKVSVISTVNWNPWTSATITSIVECRPPGSVLWKDWPQEKRDEAVRLLNPSDWQDLISSMPEVGRLNPGDKVNAPTVIIPGQEEDDPNTPADERLLKKQPGFFTNPGKDDFDYDADGTADSADPEPQNPSVPTASSNSSSSSSTPPDSNEPLDTSQEPRPEPLSEIPETARAKDLAEAKAAELRETIRRKDLPRATAAVVDTKTVKVYYGTSGKPLPTTIDEYLAEHMPNPSLTDWPDVANCAEFKAVNNALLDGANIEDLEVHTVRTWTGEAFPRCANCRITIDGANVTSDP